MQSLVLKWVWALMIKSEGPDSSKALAWCSPSAETHCRHPRPYFPVLAAGSCSCTTGSGFLFAPEDSAAGLPVPSPSQGEALHGDNGPVSLLVPCLKTPPMFVMTVYALRCTQQDGLSSALALLPPPLLLQTDGPCVRVMSQLHLANKSNTQNHRCIHKE